MDTGQPTAIVYRTTKGWRYGIEGRASHGAGHKLCSGGFYTALGSLLQLTGSSLPVCDANEQRCAAGQQEDVVEECFWEALGVLRKAVEHHRPMAEAIKKVAKFIPHTPAAIVITL